MGIREFLPQTVTFTALSDAANLALVDIFDQTEADRG